ncbi:hypothetical protein EHM92_01200 [bacterium]|nr:MAG: hypothetical protein EHM92_01200 [bacterium]
MTLSKEETYECPRCAGEAHSDDDFCTHCGELFLEQVPCSVHPDRSAKGACIICAIPFCPECGGWIGRSFLCNQHSGYEIYEEHVRVFGTNDTLQAEYARSCLEKAGLHPIIFSRKASPLSLGAPDYTLFRASGDFDGHIVNELKVMVPAQEVPEAEKRLKGLDLIK